MHQGSCLCGAVKYELKGELGPIFLCHCVNCRKANGTAFATSMVLKSEDFTVIQGQESLGDYQSSPGVHRMFCKNCASPLFSKRDETPEIVRLRLGTLDTPIEAKPTAHIFVSHKAEWFDIHDDLPQYAERP